MNENGVFDAMYVRFGNSSKILTRVYEYTPVVFHGDNCEQASSRK